MTECKRNRLEDDENQLLIFYVVKHLVEGFEEAKLAADVKCLLRCALVQCVRHRPDRLTPHFLAAFKHRLSDQVLNEVEIKTQSDEGGGARKYC